MADKGFRVLLHDRRNCGFSDVAFDGSKSEYEVWADDLELLLRQLGMAPAIIGGSSSGARLALNFVRMYPQSVSALMLWRVTGGGFAVKRLAERYYDQYIRLAGEGGMAAVCAEEHFAELIRNRPSNRDKLMAMDPQDLIACMRAWRGPFVAGAELPVVGATDADLRAIKVPTCIIPGNDLTHNSGNGCSGCEVHSRLRNSHAPDARPERRHGADRRVVHPGGRHRVDLFANFLTRKLPRASATAALSAALPRLLVRIDQACPTRRRRDRPPPACRCP